MSLQGLVNLGHQGVMGPVGPTGAPGYNVNSVTVCMNGEYVVILAEDLPDDIREYMKAQIIAQKLEGNRPTYGNSGTSGCAGVQGIMGPSGPIGATAPTNTTGTTGTRRIQPSKRSWFKFK